MKLSFVLCLYIGGRETVKIVPKPLRSSYPALSPQCASCLNNLESDRAISALGQDWHVDCFRCSVCDTELSHWYFEKEGLLFCRDDYIQRFGTACQQCKLFSLQIIIVRQSTKSVSHLKYLCYFSSQVWRASVDQR